MKLIRDLAVSYIERDSCIVLLTVACESMSTLKFWNPSDKAM